MPKFNNIKEKQKFFFNAVRKIDASLPDEASPELVAFFVLHMITRYDDGESWETIKEFVDFSLGEKDAFNAARQAVEDADNMLDIIKNSKDK